MILNKSQLVNNINAEISDQAHGEISPYDIRHNLLDIIDSVHNLTFDKELRSLNFATLPSGTTKLGQSTLENLGLAGYLSEHNTAIGFESLRSNYQGTKNTAVGSKSLPCNVYGNGNVGIGYNSLAGNTVGSLNVAVGNLALHNNKSGNGNIAIGHGAGYYASKTEQNKLYIASHPVDDTYICNNPDGIGLTPLIYGDLANIKLGVGIKSFHNYGMLQVAGSISPSGSSLFDIGHSLYKWRKIFLSDSIEFSNFAFSSDNSISIRSSGNIAPLEDKTYSLGSNSKIWGSGFFEDLFVTGTATINELVTLQTSIYENKTLYLASDDDLNPILNDSQLTGGGIVLKSTTVGQLSSDLFGPKDYVISFRPPSNGMPCFNDDFNAVWYSNINFQVPSNRYIKSNSIVSYDPISFDAGDCFGLFFNSGITYISRKNVLNQNPGLPDGHIAGIGNVNFISNSGEAKDYSLVISSLESGVNVSQRFLTGTKVRQKDSSSKDILNGFELKYINDSFSHLSGPNTDRFIIGSYNKTSSFVNGLILMKDNYDHAVLSITNIPSTTQEVLPKTILNVRSIQDCVGRFTAENNGFHKSAIQLLGHANCETSGVEIAYLNNSGVTDISMYNNSNKNVLVRMKHSNQIGLVSSGVISNSTITIGNSGMSTIPTIALKDNTFVSNIAVIGESGYGKIFNLRSVKIHADQFNTLYYADSSGNYFDLVVNKNDNIDGRAVFTDADNGNTFAGYYSPFKRLNLSSAIRRNSTYGYKALHSIISGSGNISIGYNSLYDLASGNNNIVIGSQSASGLVTSHNNIIIGNNAFNKLSHLSQTSGNIIIGHSGVGNSSSGNYNFVVGSKENVILLDGKIGPSNSDKRLILPSGGRLYLNNLNDTESLHIKANTIEVIDSGGSNYPENELMFKFTGNNSTDLLILNHNSNDNLSYYTPIWNYPSNFNEYWFPSGGVIDNLPSPSDLKPFMQLNGNFRLKGNIQFSDGTYLGSTKPIQTNRLLSNSGISLGNSGIALANSGISMALTTIIEGYMPNGMLAPSSPSQKTSGILVVKKSNWADSGNIFIFNRDHTSVIHSGAYVIAARVNDEYRPIWISAKDTTCTCCGS